MKRGLLAVAALAAAVGLTGCVDGGFGLAVHESVDVTKPLSANGRLTLQNTNGSVRVAAWDEPRVRIEAVKSAANERALRDLDVAIEGQDDHVDVRSRMPRGHWFGHGGKVDYTITVPRGASVSVRNVNGRVELQDLSGAVHAENVNGSLHANELAGPVEASTVNGSVEVRLARIDAASRNRISTTNGSVRVILPRDAGADVVATTVNGAVHCDFDVDGKTSRRRIEGRIGGGGARFELETVNGSANIDRGLSATTATATATPKPSPRFPAEAAPSPAR
jgi:autotransporter translocation and assembly factor TamB